MKIFHFILILIKFTTALPITSHFGLEKRTAGTEFYSPIFTTPSTYSAGSGGLDGASTPPIPSAPWPFGKGTTGPANSGWVEAPGTKYSVANLPTFGPHGVLDMTEKPASPAKPVASSSWAPLGLVGDLVSAMKPKVEEEPYLVKHVNGGVNDGRAVELARLAVAGEEVSAAASVASDICPTCGRGPSGWEKVVKWFKGAWNSVKGVFKKKDKQD